MASRSIQDLDPRVVEMAGAILAAWKAAGLKILVTCTWRGNVEQEDLWQKGRDEAGKIVNVSQVVTHARAGQSLHNFGLALDFVPLTDGKPDWDDTSPVWEQAARIAQGVDSRIVWGGDWQKKKIDRPHLEWSLGNLGSRVA